MILARKNEEFFFPLILRNFSNKSNEHFVRPFENDEFQILIQLHHQMNAIVEQKRFAMRFPINAESVDHFRSNSNGLVERMFISTSFLTPISNDTALILQKISVSLALSVQLCLFPSRFLDSFVLVQSLNFKHDHTVSLNSTSSISDKTQSIQSDHSQSKLQESVKSYSYSKYKKKVISSQISKHKKKFILNQNTHTHTRKKNPIFPSFVR